MRVLILGAAPRHSEDDNPVWLAEHGGKILLERFVDACSGLDATLIFAVRQQDIKRHHIDRVISIAAPSAHIVPISGETQGAACTALLCVHLIPGDDELLILNSNEFLNADYRSLVKDFKSRQLDGGVACFQSIHPRYSYMLPGEDGLIIEASEKRPISRHATAGFYWFNSGADFINAAQDMIRKDVQVDGKFFISLTFNEMILKQKRLGLVQIEAKDYIPLKSQRQIAVYENEQGGDGETGAA